MNKAELAKQLAEMKEKYEKLERKYQHEIGWRDDSLEKLDRQVKWKNESIDNYRRILKDNGLAHLDPTPWFYPIKPEGSYFTEEDRERWLGKEFIELEKTDPELVKRL